MSWSNPTVPNLPDYMLFVQNVMDIDPLFLPISPPSPFFGYAFNQALALVVNVRCNAGIDYTLAVYNCAGHIQLRITPDQDGRTYFANARNQNGLQTLAAGLVQSATDNGTTTSLAVPDALKQLTIGDLGFFKTSWGRDYLSFAQDFGGIWGLS